MRKIAVIGSGTMGLGIALAFALQKYDVLIRDMDDTIIRASEARLSRELDKLAAKGKMDADEKADILTHMTFTTNLTMAADADLVVEAAVESLDIKRIIFDQLDKLCKQETILATNTASISITDIAAATRRPDRCIGMHFFHPATVMKLVEVIRGAHTSDETCAAASRLARAIGKNPVEVHEASGFVGNRQLAPIVHGTVDLAGSGITSVEGGDTAMKLAARHPAAHLALEDLMGCVPDRYGHMVQ